MFVLSIKSILINFKIVFKQINVLEKNRLSNLSSVPKVQQRLIQIDLVVRFLSFRFKVFYDNYKHF